MKRFLALALALLLGPAACDDDGPTTPLPPDGSEVAVVLNSIDRSLTVFPVQEPTQTSTIGLAPDGSPVTLAVRGTLAAIPLGSVPAVAIADLSTGSVIRTVGLPAGSQATGVAFVNDSIALVANPALDTVSPVNVRRGTRGDDITVGGFPQTIVVDGDRAFVLNAELGDDFLPERTGTLTVIDRTSLEVLGTIELSGFNPTAAAVGPDGRLYIVHAGSFGAGDGSLSIVSPTALEEVEHHEGFGEFPGSAAFGPGGRLHIGSFGFGIAIWDPATGSFVRPPEDAIAPAGIPSTSGVGFDGEGRLYALEPECSAPASAFRLDSEHEVEVEIPVGICPIGIAFTTLTAGE